MKSYIDHSFKAFQDFSDADILLVGTFRDINVVQHTSQGTLEEDNDVLNEPEDIRDATDMCFGDEPVDIADEETSEDVEGVYSALDVLKTVDDDSDNEE